MSKPIRSREGLTRCAACRAHIHAAERPSDTECPFCGATLRGAPARRPALSGRGGLLAAALFAFGASACGGDAADDGTTVEPEDTSGGDDVVDDGSDDGSDDGIADDGSDDGYDEEGSDGPPAVALYGVPPQ